MPINIKILFASILFLSAASCFIDGKEVNRTGAAAPLVAEDADYLPVTAGRKWVLKSKTVATPVVLEVVSKSGDDYTLKFDNPWLSSELVMQSRQGKHYIKGMRIGGQNAPLPDDTLYFDFTAKEGANWSNAIGKMTVVTRNKTVKAGGTTYDNCIQIREVNKEGNKLYWTFAPRVGFVQFGEDSWGFMLDSSASSAPASSSSAPVPSGARPSAAASSSSATASDVMVALSANPSANEAFNPKTVQARFDQAVNAGVTFVYFAPKWNQLEPRSREYNFKDLDFHLKQAGENDLPVVLNLRVVDTNQRVLPADLQSLPFNHPKVREALLRLVNQIAPRLKGRVSLVMIGNEVNSYFESRRDEIDDYLELYTTAASKLKELVPGARTSVNVTFDGLKDVNGYLKPLMGASDFLSLTYYPLNPDFTFRDPRDVPGDFKKMIQAANGKKVLLQEVGYASSELNNSSEEKQAQFISAVFDQLRLSQGTILGAHFFLMSDLSDQVVEGFAQYYKMPGADKFKSFLKTLGMSDDQGRPKKSWKVFQAKAVSMK